jgi:hypothetical protein
MAITIPEEVGSKEVYYLPHPLGISLKHNIDIGRLVEQNNNFFLQFNCLIYF